MAPFAPTTHSFRFRIAAAFTLWTAVLHITLALVAPALVRLYLISQLDSELVLEAKQAVDRLRSAPVDPGIYVDPPGEFMSADPSADQVRFATVTTPAGAAIAAWPRGASLDQTDSRDPGVPATGTASIPSTPTASTASRVRAVSMPFSRDEGMYILHAGRSLEPMYSMLSLVVRAGLVFSLISLVCAAAIGWAVAGIVVSRIQRLSDALKSIEPEDLSSRSRLEEGSDEIGRLGRDANLVLDRIAAAFEAHEYFIAHVAHELKTPLTALLTSAQVMKYRDPGPVANEKFVLTVEDEMRRLRTIVESFLMLARFAHGKRFVAESRVDMNDITLDSVQHASLIATQHQVKIRLNVFDPGEGEGPTVRGDAELLRVAIDNLVRNAVKYTKQGTEVRVDVACSGDDVLVTVRDDGPGIPEDHLESIFNRFAQAPGNATTRGGAGLGLTIAKGIADLHEGRISVMNHPQGGCVFTLTLKRIGVVSPPAAPAGVVKALRSTGRQAVSEYGITPPPARR